MKKINKKRWLKIGMFICFLILSGIVYKLDLLHHFSLASLKENKSFIKAYYHDHPIIVIAGFVGIYILNAALSLPAAAVLSLAGGALFGTILGALLIDISATAGATLAFLAARFLFRETLESKYKPLLDKFDKGIQKNGLYYLLFLRLVPLIPFFAINGTMGLTRLPTRTFVLGSFVGMIPGVIVYANAGSQLSKIDSLQDIVSPGVIIAFALLGALSLIPILYKKFQKPKSTDEI